MLCSNHPAQKTNLFIYLLFITFCENLRTKIFWFQYYIRMCMIWWWADCHYKIVRPNQKLLARWWILFIYFYINLELFNGIVTLKQKQTEKKLQPNIFVILHTKWCWWTQPFVVFNELRVYSEPLTVPVNQTDANELKIDRFYYCCQELCHTRENVAKLSATALIVPTRWQYIPACIRDPSRQEVCF